MRSRPGDDFPSPVRETVIINGWSALQEQLMWHATPAAWSLAPLKPISRLTALKKLYDRHTEDCVRAAELTVDPGRREQ
jgi:hypothetical protein